jgi:hypothetical protein
MRSKPIVATILLCAGLGAAGSAAAHHAPRFDRCKSFTLSGEIEQIVWAHPHVQLSIKGPDGTTYKATWLSPRQLNIRGIEEGTLKPGDRVTLTAGRRSDDGPEVPMLLSEIHRASDGWEWSQPPQGC